MKPQAWSHTALEQFKTCPKQYYHIRVAKDVKDTQNDAALWGDLVHKAFEKAIKEGGALPESFSCFQRQLDEVRMLPGALYAEQQLAMNRDMEPCDWFDNRTWVRGIVDVLVIDGERAVVLDWKTGKNRKPSSRQLQLFALLVFAHYPQVKVVKTSFAWLKFVGDPKGYIDTEVFKREQIAVMWQGFIPDLAAFAHAFKTETFTAKSSGLCNGWCPVQQCPYWKPKR